MHLKTKLTLSLALIALAAGTTACAGTKTSSISESSSQEILYPNSPENCSHAYVLQDDSHESTDTESGLRHYLCTLCGDEYQYETDPYVYTKNPKTGEPVTQAGAYNPLLPDWEHVPDAEPQVFWSKEDNEWRVYLYGSHDEEGKTFCSLNYVLWSAPVYDLSDWRFEGKILDISEQNTYGGFSLFAPDCAYDVTTDTYYMIANQMQSMSVLRKGKTPAGPFVEDEGIWTISTKACYDPTIYIENGTIYIGGSCMRQIYSENESISQLVAEDGYSTGMSHIGVIYQLKKDLSDGDGIESVSWMPNDERDFLPIYEGPSLVGWVDELQAYVYLYVANDIGADGTSYTSSLAYMWTDDLMNGTWHYGENGVEEIYHNLTETYSGNHGNTIADVTGRYQKDFATGELTFNDFPTYTHSNDHGGMAKINGKWYVFGHRHTNAHTNSRQTIAGEVSVSMQNGAPLITPTEYTSSGIAGSINAYTEIPAYRACYLLQAVDHQAPSSDRANPHSDCLADAPYIVANREEDAKHQSYITNLFNGSVVGFQYLDFGQSKSDLTLNLLVSQSQITSGKIDIYLDAPNESQGGSLLGSVSITPELIASSEEKEPGTDGTIWSWIQAKMDTSAAGVHGIYFIVSCGDEPLCNFDQFSFQ